MRDGSGSCSENAPNQPAYLLIHFVGIGQRSGDFVAEPLPVAFAQPMFEQAGGTETGRSVWPAGRCCIAGICFRRAWVDPILRCPCLLQKQNRMDITVKI